MASGQISNRKISEAFINTLTHLHTPAQWMTQLQGENLLNESGLSQLLDRAECSVRDDPGQAQKLAAFCHHIATKIDIPTILPRASYLQGQTYALNGEFDQARSNIQAAQRGYMAIGNQFAALRTNIGLMHVLNELGDHEAVLETGQRVLDATEGEAWQSAETSVEASAGAVGSTEPKRHLLAALAHQNRGICYWQIGRYEEALAAYSAAERHYQLLDSPESLADISNNRGLVLLSLGRVREAYRALEEAATIRADMGIAFQQGQTLNSMAEAQLLLGNYIDALKALEEAKALLAPLNAASEQLITLGLMGNAYLTINLNAEALATYREAVPLLQKANMVYQLANTLWQMGKVLIRQKQYEEATEALAQAASSFRKSGNIPMLTSVLLEESVLLEMQDRKDAAVAQTQRALKLISGGDWPVQKLYLCLRMADLRLPDVSQAERYLQEAKQLTATIPLPHLRYQLNQRLGHLHLLAGEREEAQIFLEKAVAEVETLRHMLPQEAMRASFLSDKIAAYEDLIQLHLSRNDEAGIKEAFSLTERAKSRTLVDLLTGAIEASPALSANQDLSKELDGLQADLNIVYNEMLQGGNTEESERTIRISNLQERAVTLEQEISRLRLQLSVGQRSPKVDISICPPEPRQDSIDPDSPLLAYYILGEEIMAFITIAGHIHLIRHVSTTQRVQKLLDKISIQWERFHLGSEFVARHMKTLERSVQKSFHALYAELMAPIDALFGTAFSTVFETTPNTQELGDGSPQKLVIIPHGLLHLVPFHALHDGTHYLLDRYEISYAPSVTTLAHCENQLPREMKNALVIGVPDARIPAVEREVQTVAKQLQKSQYKVDLYVEEDATLAVLPNKADSCGIIHIACHGLFRADNPMFSALKLHDGWLTAADIIQLDLTGAIVTLSACESGRGHILGGDEIIGLTRAVLGAGAATLVVSQWLVQDEATAELMAAWYEQLQQSPDLASALRKAQLAVKESYAHPYYWAPFMLIGQRTHIPHAKIF